MNWLPEYYTASDVIKMTLQPLLLGTCTGIIVGFAIKLFEQSSYSMICNDSTIIVCSEIALFYLPYICNSLPIPILLGIIEADNRSLFILNFKYSFISSVLITSLGTVTGNYLIHLN